MNTTKLHFDYADREGEHVAYMDGYKVRVIREQDAENPWQAWDCQPPLLARYDRSFSTYGNMPDVLSGLSDRWIATNWRDLCKAFDRPVSDAKEHKDSYEYEHIADARRDLLTDWLYDAKPDSNGYGTSDYFTLLESICKLRRWPVLNTCSQGYSQGDYADLLLIFTPSHCEEIGCKWPRRPADRAEIVDSLKADAKLWGAWAWGDVYHFQIERDGECVGSCGGFYGTDFTESGLADTALESIYYDRQCRRKAKQARLRSLIVNRVPLSARAAILESM